VTAPESSEARAERHLRSAGRDEVDRIARLLMAAWEKAEGKPVTPSYVATFADMARAVLADPAPTAADGGLREAVEKLAKELEAENTAAGPRGGLINRQLAADRIRTALAARPAPVPDQQAVAEGLRVAADAYEQGGWISAKRHARRDLTPDGVGHWLRNRAAALTATAQPAVAHVLERVWEAEDSYRDVCRSDCPHPAHETATAQPAGGEER
jgi:hypothetical protein